MSPRSLAGAGPEEDRRSVSREEGCERVGSIETCEHSSDWGRRDFTMDGLGAKRLFAIMPKWIAQMKGIRVH